MADSSITAREKEHENDAKRTATSSSKNGWNCSQCTYRHEPPNEHLFLACSLCQTPKQVQKPATSTKITPKKLFSHPNARQSQKTLTMASQTTTSSSSTTITTTTTSRKRSLMDALRPQPASSFVPRARVRYVQNNNNTNQKSGQERSGSNQPNACPTGEWRNVTDTELATLCPLTIIRNVLPKQTAATLLKQLEDDSAQWIRGNWIIHGKEHAIPRTTATYYFEDDTQKDGNNNNNEEEEVVKYSDTPIRFKGTTSPELQQAAKCITDVVHQLRPWMMNSWKPTFAFANRYANGSECVAWHSDHITTLGPRPIIVGLTLGACRRFELRQQQPQPSSSSSPMSHYYSNDNTNDSPSTNITTGDGDSPLLHASVPAPHNSAIIMWNDAQESWHHAVPRCSDDVIGKHPHTGLVRISLTFRQERINPSLSAEILGQCHCGRPAGLKAKHGKYFLMCQPYGKDKHKTCSFWKPCDWANREAAILKRQEMEQQQQQQDTGIINKQV